MRETGQTTDKEVWLLSIRQNMFGRVEIIILPGLSAVGNGLFHLWDER